MLSFKEFITENNGVANFSDLRYRRPSLSNIKLPIVNRTGREIKRTVDKYSGKNFINKWTKASRWKQWAKRKVGYYSDTPVGKTLRAYRQVKQGRIALPLIRSLPVFGGD